MCPPPNEVNKDTSSSLAGPSNDSNKNNNNNNSRNHKLTAILATVVAALVVIELALIIGLDANKSSNEPATIVINTGSIKEDETTKKDVQMEDELVYPEIAVGQNFCEGANPKVDNVACVVDAVDGVGPQAGANVTKGYKGSMEVDHEPVTTPFWQNSMCPVNVHWHLGSEHYSLGQFDENGDGPNGNTYGPEGTNDNGYDIQPGYRCSLYDEQDAKFTTSYEWKHCLFMEVGETYEVHWPHSAAGACGTPNQYQTPFYDGVFCHADRLTNVTTQVGVQAQVFTVVNDESYFYPDLIRGMVVDGKMGLDIAKYTGSTTGSSRNNEICSEYSPITWQVDRQCHLISASSFDKLCLDMKLQRDDMYDDYKPHGSRVLVSDELAADNGVRHLRATRA